MLTRCKLSPGTSIASDKVGRDSFLLIHQLDCRSQGRSQITLASRIILLPVLHIRIGRTERIHAIDGRSSGKIATQIPSGWLSNVNPGLLRVVGKELVGSTPLAARPHRHTGDHRPKYIGRRCCYSHIYVGVRFVLWLSKRLARYRLLGGRGKLSYIFCDPVLTIQVI